MISQNAFSNLKIERIKILLHVSEIHENLQIISKSSKKSKSIEFSDDLEINCFKNMFNNCNIEEINIPINSLADLTQNFTIWQN